MTVTKSKDMDASRYIELLAEAGNKISEIEHIELAGYLLRRDMDANPIRETIFKKIISHDNYFIADLMASCLIAESPDTVWDLVQGIKHIVTEHYKLEAESLIKAEEEFLKANKKIERDEEGDLDQAYEDHARESV